MRYQSVLVLGFLTAIATQAQSASLKTFEAGERVKAAEVNGNFEYLEQKINPLVNDSAPSIEVLNFGYDSSIARYTGDLIVSDDTELFRIKVQIGRVEASKDFSDASLDFVYIDGDHSYESVKQDLNSWYPKLKKFGVMCGDDYAHITGRGVVEAVNEFAFEKKLIVITGKRGQFWFVKTKI